MGTMLEYVLKIYNDLIYERMDQRVRGFLLMGSPFPVMFTLVGYVLFVMKVGPWWMKDRPAFNTEKAMLLYNVVQMIINAYFVHAAISGIWIPGHYTMTCPEPIYAPDDPTEYFILSKFYWFLLSRWLDLLDTVFMVLKKNNHQVTFLHTYHHVLVAGLGWMLMKYLPGGQDLVFFGTINGLVHLVMYFYYFLTSYDPSYKKSIWFKKLITTIQLVQFVILLVLQMIRFFNPRCNYPKGLTVLYITQAVLMLILFARFYHAAYVKKQSEKPKTH